MPTMSCLLQPILNRLRRLYIDVQKIGSVFVLYRSYLSFYSTINFVLFSVFVFLLTVFALIDN